MDMNLDMAVDRETGVRVLLIGYPMRTSTRAAA
jgi:hypothetical protein